MRSGLTWSMRNIGPIASKFITIIALIGWLIGWGTFIGLWFYLLKI